MQLPPCKPMRLLGRTVAALVLASSSTLGQTTPSSLDGSPIDDQTIVRIQQAGDAYVQQQLEQFGSPGISAALCLPEGSILTFVAGFASQEDRELMTPDHLLLSGSVGKTYVTAALHHAVAHSLLSLDDRAATHLKDEPWFARLPNASDVTITQLLRHQTGIPRYVFDPEFWRTVVTEPDRVWEPEDLLRPVLDAAPLFAAGEGWAYSDTNYIVIGVVLEKITEQPFYDYVSESLLEPHGLERTLPSDRRDLPGMSQGYSVALRNLGVPHRVLSDGVFRFNPQFEWCGGGYASTPADLARWAQLLYSGQAFDGTYLETMLDDVPAEALGAGTSYGLGVIRSKTSLGELYGHDGFMTGYLTTMGYFPDHGIAVTCQWNTDDQQVTGSGPRRQHLVELASRAMGAARLDGSSMPEK